MSNRIPLANRIYRGQRVSASHRRRRYAVHALLFALILGLTSPSAGAAELISPLWPKAKTSPRLRAAALSPDGKVAGFISASGRIGIFSRNGNPLWQAEAPETNTLVLNASGAIAFPRMDPAQHLVYILNSKGKLLRRHKLRDTIWCAALDSGGRNAVVGTGSGRIYYYTLTPSWASYRRWNAQGVPSTVSCSSDGRYIAAGTWGDSGVETYRPSGHYLWRYVHENHNLFFDARISPSSKLVMAIQQPNPGDQTGRIILWTADGKISLDLELRAYRLRAMLSKNEQYLAVTDTHMITLSKKRLPEQKVMVYNHEGRRIWEKGGLFFAPTLVSIAPDGRWVLCHDGNKNLYLLGGKGKILQKYDLPMRIRTTLASDDGRTVLVQGAGGELQLFQIK